MEYPPFPGIRQQGMAFLEDLRANNERDWFKPRKATYDDELLWPFRCLLVDCGQRLAQRGLPLIGDPKAGTFRIYRDTRFSKNKAPYKTQVSGVLSRTGSRKDVGSVYIHVEPGNVFLASGYWRPENKLLRHWRTRMADAPEAFLAMVEETEGHDGLKLEPADKLKRMPRGFESLAESDIAPFLKWKSFVAIKKLGDDVVTTPAFADDVVAFCEQSLPLL